MSGESGVAPGDVAVVGMALRVPGANDWRTFRRNVMEGVESIRTLTPQELRAAGETEENLASPFYVPRWAGIADTELFDAGFFGLSAREASVMDPQHRHFMEVCVEALDDAGLEPSRFPGPVGVFAASGYNAYFARHILPRRELVDDIGFFLLRHTGNDKDFLPTRISYCLGLRGPSIAVQTACSSSLVAIHMAAQSLLLGECDAAIAGGVTLELPLSRGYLYREGEILSPDGRCRAFDARASGTVFGSGAGAVVLRRLEDALRDGDPIHAVIKGSAVNNDGKEKVGYLAPSVEGQARCVVEALGVAGVSPEQIGFVECHGTGTPVGDPIELHALTNAFREGTRNRGYCAIGSAKPNIGHLDTPAGVVSFIKAALAVRFGEVPPLVHFEKPNPALAIEASPFYARSDRHAWTLPGPRRASVNSLGVGGTNAHVVLEEGPARTGGASSRRFQLFTWSGRTPEVAAAFGERLAAAEVGADLADLASTLARREPAAVRQAAAIGDLGEAHREVGLAARGQLEQAPLKRIFAFAGGGAAHPDMGRDLHTHEPVYRRALDECLDLLDPALRTDVRRALLPGPDDESWAIDAMERATIQLPAQTATQLAMVALLESFGVRPDVCIGHSLGEYACAHLAGVMSREDTLRLVSTRGALFDTLPAGGMVAVVASEDEARELLREHGGLLAIAAVNGQRSVVVSGPFAELPAFEARLDERGVDHTRLRIRVAAHSPLLEPILRPFHETLGRIQLAAPRADRPSFVSNLTGEFAGPEVATPTYWVNHLRQTVRYAAGAARLFGDGPAVVVDVGPGQTQVALLGMTEGAGPIVPAMRRAGEKVEDDRQLVRALGQLWTNHAFDAEKYWGGERRQRVHAPARTFEHARHWIEPPAFVASEVVPAEQKSELRALPLSRWFSKISFRPVDRMEVWKGRRLSWFGVLPPEVAAELTQGGRRISHGGELGSLDAEKLVRDPPDLVVLAIMPSSGHGAFEQVVRQLAAAVGASGSLPPIVVVTWGAMPTRAGDAADPGLAAILGPVLVAPREAPGLVVRWLDLDGDTTAEEVPRALATAVLSQRPCLALRNGRLLERILEPVALPLREAPDLGPGDVVLVTGGTRGIGREIGLASARAGATVVLCGRSEVPAPELAGGGDIRSMRGDVCSADDVTAWVQEARALGRLRLVVHAAAAIDDKPMLAKNAEEREAILRPKVEGAKNLLEAVGDAADCDVVLFSSTSTELGPPGQVDYVAANAALEALAAAHPRARVLGWGMWREAGMLRRMAGVPERSVHPFAPAPVHGKKACLLSERDWVLDEHRLASGAAVLPGTAYVEMLRVASSDEDGFRPFALEGLELIEPLLPQAGRSTRVVIEQADDSVVISSEDLTGQRHHARARVATPSERPEAVRLAEILARCTEGRFDAVRDGAWRQQPDAVRFGPRWQVVREASLGKGESIARLELDERFAGDLANVAIHPALLDLATAFALELEGRTGGGDVFVPVRYERFEVWAPFPRVVWAIARTGSGAEFSADVDIVDEQGLVIARASGFAMKRVPERLLRAPAGAGPVRAPTLLDLGLEHGIGVDDGLRALWSFLAGEERQLFASSLDLGLLEAVLAPPAAEKVVAATAGGDAPRDDVERAVGAAFENLLGHSPVHLEDDFFALGGHSLLAVRLFNRLKRELGVDLPLSVLFEASTVRALSEQVRGGPLQEATAAPVVETRPELPGAKSLVPIRRTGTGHPFFCVHGAGGNVLNFFELSRRLRSDRPIYGLQARGVDGETQPHASIEAMASDYLAEVRAVQPEGPYIIGGYSGGGVVAFEMARQLTAAGESVAALVLLDTFVPGLVPRRTPLKERLQGLRAEGMPYLRKMVQRGLGRRAEGWVTRSKLEEALANGGSVPIELRDAWLTGNFLQVSRGYRVQPWQGRAVLYRAEVTDPYFGYVGFELGWKDVLPGLEVAVVPGNHDTLVHEPNVRRLAEMMDGLLAELA